MIFQTKSTGGKAVFFSFRLIAIFSFYFIFSGCDIDDIPEVAPLSCNENCILITGLVKHTADGTPIENAQVTLFTENEDFRNSITTIETTTEGEFEFSLDPLLFENQEQLLIQASSPDLMTNEVIWVDSIAPFQIWEPNFNYQVEIEMSPQGFIALQLKKNEDAFVKLTGMGFKCTAPLESLNMRISEDQVIPLVIPADQEVCFQLKYESSGEQEYNLNYYHPANSLRTITVNLE